MNCVKVRSWFIISSLNLHHLRVGALYIFLCVHACGHECVCGGVGCGGCEVCVYGVGGVCFCVGALCGHGGLFLPPCTF